jgi:hypothetical protein
VIYGPKMFVECKKSDMSLLNKQSINEKQTSGFKLFLLKTGGGGRRCEEIDTARKKKEKV